MSSRWRIGFRALYRVLRLADPVIRGWWLAAGLGNVVELRVPSRRSGRMRSILVGVLRTGDALYLGHPNGHVQWTLDLAAAGEGELRWPGAAESVAFRPVWLAPGVERSAAIRATRQHPFPGNLVYRLGRRHIEAVGVFCRLEPAARDRLDEERPPMAA